MFNSYNVSNPQTVNINAVSGTIVKNYKDSFILRFKMNSEMANTILDRNPRLREDAYRDSKFKPIVVLQVMLCGEKELLAEVMWKEDFDKIYESQEESEGCIHEKRGNNSTYPMSIADLV